MLGVGTYGELLNLELDLRLVKNSFSFLKKLLRTSSRSRSGQPIMESRGLEASLGGTSLAEEEGFKYLRVYF